MEHDSEGNPLCEKCGAFFDTGCPQCAWDAYSLETKRAEAAEAELAELRERVEVEALHARRHVITLRCSGRLDASHECERFSDMLRRLLEPEGGEHG